MWQEWFAIDKVASLRANFLTVKATKLENYKISKIFSVEFIENR